MMVKMAATEALGSRERALAEELGWITEVDLQRFTVAVLRRAPAYFWTVPSSISQRFHPPDEWLPGGLVLHTRRVAKVARTMVEGWRMPISSKNTLVAACLLHDTCKYGPGPTERPHLYEVHCRAAHDLVASTPARRGVPKALVSKLVLRHMGPYGPEPWDPAECSPLEIAIYTADYLASRPNLFENGTGRRSWARRRP